MIILILLSEQVLKLWSWKKGKVMEKVMESHGILKSSKSTNPGIFGMTYFLGHMHFKIAKESPGLILVHSQNNSFGLFIFR